MEKVHAEKKLKKKCENFPQSYKIRTNLYENPLKDLILNNYNYFFTLFNLILKRYKLFSNYYY